MFMANETLPVKNSTECIYANCIPPFAEQGLEDLYGSLYASLPQLQCYDLAHVHTYAAWCDGHLSTILLYCLDGSRIRVINEGMRISPDELSFWVLHEGLGHRLARAVQEREEPAASIYPHGRERRYRN
jgi:hypothetical protein